MELVGIVFISFVLLHAIDEFKSGLAPYLEEEVGFKTGKWLNYALLLLALAIILLPLILVGTVGFDVNLAVSFVIGGLLGDAFFNTLDSIINKKKGLPRINIGGNLSFFAFMFFSTIVFSPIAFTLGILAFVSLWPSLWVVKQVVRSPIVN